ncbi:hypothetical protein B5F40_05505 [Gordonibacter sp. An230]|uniref:YxeA family protein n=1 Tax=Gordonibacter sp. An230 TaxID=1965592 RepID=UPI000B381E9E|nr:YxeA family protein [Gordonibacter sp. An230]OUO90916.1 hypothetical protein B5F40_05505 [Gordonibacter sp. An230]
MHGRSKPLIALVIAAVIVAALASAAGWAFYGESGRIYTRIDNAQVSPIEPRAGMKYEYQLEAVDTNGTRSEVSFQTERELRDGAYLELETKPLRGVVAWEERTPEELPSAVLDALGKG